MLSFLAELLGVGPRQKSGGRPKSRTLDEAHREFERALGYRFTGSSALTTALTHPSAVSGPDNHYERLEFLGDAVLDLAIADLLMNRFPTAKEGVLSKLRASIVNGRTLAAKAQQIGVDRVLHLGKGEEKSGGRGKVSILAAALEAVVGAVYVDGGLKPAKQVVERLFAGEIGGPAAERDYKTELQEAAYRRFHSPPVYELVSTEGPHHARRFTTRIRVGGRELGRGEGSSKKQSEQAAARQALERIEDDEFGVRSELP